MLDSICLSAPRSRLSREWLPGEDCGETIRTLKTPYLSADQLARHVGVVKTTMANKAALITKTLNLGIYELDLIRLAMLEQHPLTWMVMVNGFIVDVRTLPPEIQDEARRRRAVPDIEARRAA